ncbi:hypothetical protein [Nostoc sp.]
MRKRQAPLRLRFVSVQFWRSPRPTALRASYGRRWQSHRFCVS